MESTSEDTLISSGAVRRIIERFQSDQSSIRCLHANEDPDGLWPNDDELSKSLLHVAAETGDAPMVKALLAVGASADFENEWGLTALRFACENGHAECVRLLLKAGADANNVGSMESDEVLYPPLCLAAGARGRGSTECVAHLLECGARIDQKCDEGLSALHHAAESGLRLEVEYLIRAGANVNLLTTFPEHADVFRRPQEGKSAFTLALGQDEAPDSPRLVNYIERRHILGMLLRAGATIDLDALRDHVAIGSDAPTWRYALKLIDAGGYEAFVQIYRRVLTAPRSAITRFLKNKFGRGAPPGVAAIILAFWKPPGGH
jgi:ankyrin repeat protein